MRSKSNLKSILIIGGTGFIGLNVAKKLAKKNIKVFSISTKLPPKKKKIKKVKYLICDISNKKKLSSLINKYSRFDYVLNLGGNVNHKNNRNIIKSHLTGCKNLANIFLKKKIQKFIQIGSSAEYGNCKSPHKETYIIKSKNLKSDYGRSKFNATNFLINYYKKFNFPVVILRAYQIYGPYQKFNRIIPFVINSCIKKKKFACSEGKQVRDFLFIDDFVNVVEKFLNNKTSLNGQIFNIGSAKPVKIKKIIKMIVKQLNGGEPNFGILNLRSDEFLNMYPSIKKVKKVVNWYPKVSLKRGLKKTINFYKKIHSS